MNPLLAYLVLSVAAALEAGGDAIVRKGLHAASTPARFSLFALGAAVLFAYGLTVNTPPWDFGKLLGVYVTLFFVIAQIVNLMFFGARPDLPIFVGGALIVAGGLVITFWRTA
jgi:small multidrug resistance family-3 protein